MRKSIVAAAAATAVFDVGAQSHVQLYGRANLGFDNFQAEGAATDSPAATRCGGAACNFSARNRVYDAGSRVGVRGSEDLGGGLRAIFQIETGINIDSGSQTGQNGIANPDTGFWASRDSFVGIQSDRFGRLTFGKQSAYWNNYVPGQPWNVSSIAPELLTISSPLSSTNFSGVVVGPVARESNAVQYSFLVERLLGTVTYGIPINAARPSESIGPGASAHERTWAASARYSHPAFELQADWATRYNTNQVPGRDATGWKLGGAWKYQPGAKVALILQRLQDKNTFGTGLSNAVSTTTALPCSATIAVPGIGVTQATAQAQLYAASLVPGSPAAVFNDQVLAGAGATCPGDTLRQDMWTLAWEHSLGPFMLIAEYSQAGEVRGSTAAAGLPDSHVRAYTLGARYSMSKRTWLYAVYAQVDNGRNNYVDFWGGWHTSASQLAGNYPGLPPRSAGADPRLIRFGVAHEF
jgi:predicted porin